MSPTRNFKHQVCLGDPFVVAAVRLVAFATIPLHAHAFVDAGLALTLVHANPRVLFCCDLLGGAGRSERPAPPHPTTHSTPRTYIRGACCDLMGQGGLLI